MSLIVFLKPKCIYSSGQHISSIILDIVSYLIVAENGLGYKVYVIVFIN